MASKRMFTMKIVDSDAFLDMPLSTQCLYFHLNMRADDDGFIGNPKRITKLVGCNEDDLKVLIAKRFLLVFEDGVIVIKHWRMHNTIQKDRYTPTAYQDELKQLGVKNNKSYTLNPMETKCIQNVSTDIDIDTGIDKDLDLVKENKGWKYFESPVLEEAFKEFVEMRKKKKKPMSDRALKMAMGELVKHSTINGFVDEELMLKVIEQSILHCWDSFYPLKENKNQTIQTNIDWEAIYGSGDI